MYSGQEVPQRVEKGRLGRHFTRGGKIKILSQISHFIYLQKTSHSHLEI